MIYIPAHTSWLSARPGDGSRLPHVDCPGLVPATTGAGDVIWSEKIHLSSQVSVPSCGPSGNFRGKNCVVPKRPALSLALPGAESWLAPLHAEVVVEEMSVEADGRRLVADLYRPSAPRGALLLVHGLSRAGRRHPDLVRLARLLARHHRLVLVPHFDGLAAFRLSGREVAEVRAALRALAAQSPSIGLAGLS